MHYLMPLFPSKPCLEHTPAILISKTLKFRLLSDSSLLWRKSNIDGIRRGEAANVNDQKTIGLPRLLPGIADYRQRTPLYNGVSLTGNPRNVSMYPVINE